MTHDVHPTAQRPKAAAIAAGAVAVLSIVGGFVSVAADLSPDFFTAMGPTSKLSVPLVPMLPLLVVLAVLAGSRRRGLAATAGGLVGVAGAICAISGFFDGGYAAQLSPGIKAFQYLLAASLVALSVAGFSRLVTVLRHR